MNNPCVYVDRSAALFCLLAVEDLFRLLNEQELEGLKALLIKELIERKVFHKSRFMGKRYFISIDGTGVSTYK